MPTSATCFKIIAVGMLFAWANTTFAHALGHHERAHQGSVEQQVERSKPPQLNVDRTRVHQHRIDQTKVHQLGVEQVEANQVKVPKARAHQANSNQTGSKQTGPNQTRPHQHQPATDHHDAVEKSTARLSVDELIARYSRTGDDHLIEEGWRAIESELVNPTPAIWLHAAWLAQAEHRFDLARDYLAAVLEAQPRNPQAWLLEASIAMVQADYSAANEACARVMLTLGPVVALACKLRAEQQPARRAKLLKRVSQLPLDELDAGVVAWVQSAMGDTHFLAGDLGNALMSYTRAFTLNPTVQSRAALADTLIGLERFSAAVALLGEYREVPALGIRYLLAVTRAGHPSPGEVKRLDTRFKSWIDQQDYRHAREMALFYLDLAPEPELAHRLALENVRHQREFEDTKILERATTALQRANATADAAGS